jgi:hypothetical protein
MAFTSSNVAYGATPGPQHQMPLACGARDGVHRGDPGAG